MPDTIELYYENKTKISTRELISILQRQQSFQQNLPIYISSDEEGNSFHTILDIQLFKNGIVMYPNETLDIGE
tara:strand:+ start:475 stop:693 length:219 start_codon:yes stop_codon:yes gene_type:complete